uniref:Pentacotripeptide-repeat region of PRORP domain-containing protein n=1 Tax=Brassica campestris TaxID=3711 RepID=M4EG13_BRACM
MHRSLSIATKWFLRRRVNPPPPPLSFFCSRPFSGYRERLATASLHSINFDDALSLFCEMLHSRPLPTILDFTRVLTAIAKTNKHHDAVVYLCRKMEALGISHDLYTFTILIHCLCRCSRLSLALSVLAKMTKLGIEPSVVTLGSLLNGFCRGSKLREALSLSLTPWGVNLTSSFTTPSGRWSEAARLVRDMIKRRKIDPNVIFYSGMIHVFVKEGNLFEAVNLYKEMILRSVDTNVFTYNSLINGLCVDGRLGEAKRMFDSMRCSPDLVTYNTLIKGFCKSKRVEDGMRLLCEMAREGIVGDAFTYNTLIHGYCQAGKLSVALKVFGRMVDCGVAPDVVTYNVLLDCLCSKGKVENAMVMVEEMEKREMYVDIVTYSIIIRGMCRSNKVKEAWCLFCSLALKGVKPDAIAYRTMISGLSREGRRREADKLCRKMKEDGIIMPIKCIHNDETLRDHHYTSSSLAELIKVIHE